MSQKQKSPILKVNENVIRLCSIVEQMDRQIKIIKGDMESIKTYINEQKEKEKLQLPQVEEVSKGWFFS